MICCDVVALLLSVEQVLFILTLKPFIFRYYSNRELTANFAILPRFSRDFLSFFRRIIYCLRPSSYCIRCRKRAWRWATTHFRCANYYIHLPDFSNSGTILRICFCHFSFCIL